MTIYLNFYIILYVLTLIQINFLLVNHVFKSQTQPSLSILLLYLWKFSKFKSIILFLFLSLAGLPPFIMFFIKFNYLINLLYKLNFFIILSIFIIFFLNMLFYIQLFFHKNININFKFIKSSTKHYVSFHKLYLIVWFCILTFTSVFFFSDFIFIFLLIINGNI